LLETTALAASTLTQIYARTVKRKLAITTDQACRSGNIKSRICMRDRQRRQRNVANSHGSTGSRMVVLRSLCALSFFISSRESSHSPVGCMSYGTGFAAAMGSVIVTLKEAP